jgi:hypothetical protein
VLLFIDDMKTKTIVTTVIDYCGRHEADGWARIGVFWEIICGLGYPDASSMESSSSFIIPFCFHKSIKYSRMWK